MASANEELFNATIRHQIKLLRFSAGQAKQAAKILEQSEAEIVEKLKGELTEASEARLRSLLSEVRRIRTEAAKAVKQTIEESAAELAQNEAEWELEAIASSTPVQLSLTAPSVAAMKAVTGKPINGVPLEGWIGEMAQKDIQRIEQQVRLGFVQGETIDQIVGRIRGTKANSYEDGVMAITRRNAQTIARTSVNHVANAARQEVWNANADIIKGIRWCATLDGRTSDVCRGRDGQVYPIDQGPRPPGHPGCRSTTTAVLGGEEIVGERPMVRDTRTRRLREKDFRAEAREIAGEEAWKNMTVAERNSLVKDQRDKWAAENIGTVPSNMNYDSWLRKQPKEFQDEVLGKTKAQIFRDGTTLDKFIDEKGKPYTIAELKAETKGDMLNVVQPGVGMKAKALLQSGLSNEEVLAQVLKEYPDASTSMASIASYKSELKKAGLLDQLAADVPKTALKQALSVQDTVKHLEDGLPAGVKHALGGQWSTVVEELDGVPGAYGYYQAGKGVMLSGKKLSSISAVQAKQVTAHELGHLLHKQHDLVPDAANLEMLKSSAKGLSPDGKKLYGYYLASTDELIAEVYAQALSPSPLTSQGLSAVEFNKVFEPSILMAKLDLADKFPAPVKGAPTPLPGGPVMPFEVAGKHKTVGSLAKALLQQGMLEDDILAAVKAEFPDAKTSKASLASYKVELKKQGLLGGAAAPGPVVTAKAIPDVVQVPPTPEVSILKTPSAPSAVKVGGAKLKSHGLELFEQGILDSKSVAESLKQQFPQNLEDIKLENIASWKSKWKKEFPERFAEAEKLAKAAVKKADVSGPIAKPALYGKSLGSHSSKALEKLKTYFAGGGDAQGALDVLKQHFGSVNKQGADELIELAKYELATGKAAAKPYLNSAYASAAPTASAAVKAASKLPEPVLNYTSATKLSANEQQAYYKLKNWIVEDGPDSSPTKWLDIAKAADISEAQAKGLLKLADQSLLNDEVIDVSILSKVLGEANAEKFRGGKVDLTPARPAATPREGFPPPPRFTSQQRRAAIEKIAGRLDTGSLSTMNAIQKKHGLPEVTAEEAAAIRTYTGSTYRRVNEDLREGRFVAKPELQAYVEAAQSGLHKMPKHNGMTSRGLTLHGADLEKALSVYRPGAIVEEHAFISTSYGETAAFSGNVYMKIKGKTGVNVEQFSYYRREREVLYMPGTRLKVTQVEKTGSTYVIHMEEV